MSFIKDADIFVTKEEFEELDEETKWEYAESLKAIIKELKPRADKNCEECEKRMINPHDLNINYLFEDWRECRNDCNECSKEDQVFMCQVQFQIINHLAQSILDLRNRQNAIVRLVFKGRGKASEIWNKIENQLEEENQQRSRKKDMFS